jgi:hypothetical protein
MISHAPSTTAAADVSGDATRCLERPIGSPADRSGDVAISDSHRVYAWRETADLPSIDRRRAVQIRNRILRGAYDSLEVVDAVARRLLVSEDL